jgi:predicted ABC-type ATPase
MTPQKRFRMFAGPNGSGKSTLYERLRKDSIIHTELYVAADRIEAELRKKKRFVFNAYHVKVTEVEFISFGQQSGILDKHPNKDEVLKALHIKSGILTIKDPAFIDSYVASLIANYLSKKLLETEHSFCFETVMSHESKIDLLREAKRLGFKTYLYFVFTDDPNLNVKRVDLREKAGGHGVAKAKILSRYQRSLDALPDAVRIADESYLIDNSLTIEKAYDVIAQIGKGKKLVAHKNGYDFKKKLPAFYKAFKKIIP